MQTSERKYKQNMRTIYHFDMSSGLQNIYTAFNPLFFSYVVVLLFFPCMSILLVYTNFGQASSYAIIEYNIILITESVETVVLKFSVEKLVENRFIFIMGKKCIRSQKKRRGHYFGFLMSSSISVISHPVLVVCVMNGRLRFTSKWNWMSRLCRIAINLREKKAK